MLAINELSTSYLTEMDANEVDSIFGGSDLFTLVPPAAPDPFSTVAFTPLGGPGSESIANSLAEATDYAGRGTVVIGLVGGNPSFIGTQLFGL